ncbi:acyltransferase family protein [Prosthecobacter sp.]|uniref:acyltransferase family protein n=1 Tax=Prosthecobacter sp. TaxID=1965333 RepID=UPI001DD04C04|nr:acyltransferase family protein [Prosthecobacter sp.]MCB1275272.1 acyltransferase family protein [Prosthecobacter sp.]
MTSRTERLYFLDNIRSFITIWVVVLHGAIIYMEYGVDWYPVVDQQRSLFFSILIMLVEPTLMTAMFFIAAYFALPSIAARGSRAFLKSKLLRIGVPWVLGVVLVTPPVDYLILLAAKSPTGWFEFCTSEYWRLHYHQGPYWFLGVLLVFFLVFSLVWQGSHWLRTPPERISIPSRKQLAAFWALMTLGMFAVQLLWVPKTPFHIFGNVVAVMPSRIHLYSGYFIMGLVAWRNRWFSSAGYNPRLIPWVAVLVVSMALYSASRALSTDARSLEVLARVLHLNEGSTALHATARMSVLIKLMNVSLFNAMSLSALLASCALFKRHFNSTGPIQRSLAANSFGIYFIHAAVLYPIGYLFLDVQMPLMVKFTIVTSLGFFLSWAASALILRKAPFLRQVF